jgi:hypothetical protein
VKPSALFAAIAALALGAVASRPAHAAGRRLRTHFEPTDLELEDAGTLEADLQTGYVRADDGTRLVLPDLELDLGLLPNLELDLDGAYAIAGPAEGGFGFDHAAPDSLWAAIKLGLASVDGPDSGAGLGVQLGPKFPVASGSRGLGIEALLLAGVRAGQLHVACNLGAFADPQADGSDERSRGLEAGLDVDLDLDRAGVWSLTFELGGVHFLSNDPHQLLATAGAAWAPVPTLELSLTVLAGLLAGGDQAGVLLGVSPKIALWR